MRTLMILLATVTVANAEYFAHLMPNNFVDQVIVADNNFINSGAVGDPTHWMQTCTTNPATVESKNCAVIGSTWDPVTNCFVPPAPPSSKEAYEIDDTSCDWVAVKQSNKKK
jgi:hypothetical protein